LKIKFLHFIFCWTLLNLLQGTFTELTSDEGYYWYYSTSAEWGYYDHPPLLAWMIRAGYALFPNELGVRLLNILVNSATLYLFFKLLGKNKNENIIYLLVLATPLLNYMAFIIFPDGPLLFFSVLFLWTYKKFLQKQDLTAALLMGISIAGMLYSKYYGILIVAFTVISNLGLLRSKYFYLAGFISALLFIPHIWWQYAHGFQTIKYHLTGRVSGFSMKRVLEFLSQQLVAIGPFLILVPFVYSTNGIFERTLKFIVGGTYLFFLITSLKTFVHFHWTSIAIFPLVWLAIRYYSQPGKKRLLLWMTIPFIFIVLLFRIQLIWPVFGVDHVGIDYYHGRKAWAKEISMLSGGRPVVFVNDFRESSLYSFYSGNTGVALFTGEKRKSQYDIWNYEDSLRNKEVLFLNKTGFEGGQVFRSGIGKEYFSRVIKDYCSYYNVPVRITGQQRSGPDSVLLSVEIVNPGSTDLNFQADGAGRYPVLYYGFLYNGNRAVVQQDTLKIMSASDRLSPGNSVSYQFRIPMPEEKPRRILVGFRYSILPDSYNCFAKWEIR